MSWPGNAIRPSGPIAGLRILDFSRILAGPYAATLLGDLGADVIKVEHPDGDETRRWGPPFVGDTAAYFFTANRNRRCITLDLKDPADRGVAQELAADADAVIENFLPGTTERLGIDARTLRVRNPRLVYCSITGYGATSSKRRWPALDFVIQAHAGLMGVTGSQPDTPVKAGAPVADVAAGLFAAIGVLAASASARETGIGTDVEIALADAAACLLANQAMNWLLGGVDPSPAGNTHPNIAPYQTVETRDRPIAVAATSDLQFQRLCTVLGREDLAVDPRFLSNELRVANRADLVAAITDALADDDADVWVTRLNEAGVAAARINAVSEVFGDPDIASRLLTSVPGPDGPIAQVRCPIRIDGQAVEARLAPPSLGGHNNEIRASALDGKELAVET